MWKYYHVHWNSLKFPRMMIKPNQRAISTTIEDQFWIRRRKILFSVFAGILSRYEFKIHIPVSAIWLWCKSQTLCNMSKTFFARLSIYIQSLKACTTYSCNDFSTFPINSVLFTMIGSKDELNLQFFSGKKEMNPDCMSKH